VLRGRRLGVDVGSVRVGVALSRPAGREQRGVWHDAAARLDQRRKQGELDPGQ